MRLDELITSLPQVIAAQGPTAIPIALITADSRQVTPGALFVAYRGVGTDGHRFVADVLARGAAAVVGEQPAAALTVVPPTYVQVPDGRAALAWLSAAWYGHPSRAMTLVGITGTDGKTTTANLLFSILRAAGRRAGLISTVNAVIGEQTYDTGLHTTTPDAPDIQRYLAAMRDAGAEIAVLETTSHGLAQHRVTGCAFDVAVITNITHEHLDAHGSFEAYRAAKALLFQSLATGPRKPGVTRTAILNRDDGSFAYLATIPAERQISYGMAAMPPASDVLALSADQIHHTPAGIEFAIRLSPALAKLVGQGALHVNTPLIGAFNVYNILAAAAAALALGIGPEAIRSGVAAMHGVAGRMERIYRGQPFTAIVDFAHTPNALAQALTTARTLARPGGRVIAVFGSAGLRDREKRRLMGEVAAQLADLTVITAEDPRTEDLAAIMAETADALARAGKVEGESFHRIPDRQRAILFAVQQARPGDVVIVCGKGHEQSMCFGTVEHPWRDQDALVWALEHIKGEAAAGPPFILPTWNAQEGQNT
ncbi:MAG: UDP-N-acetylmuramoyl-L-alanyl-D-glutamate--2,6-diaminopimelate ligase [Anaerolineae bacterium]